MRIRCTYPDGSEPTEVTFEPGPELESTPEEIHARILRLLETLEYVELPAGGEPPLPFWSETVRLSSPEWS